MNKECENGLGCTEMDWSAWNQNSKVEVVCGGSGEVLGSGELTVNKRTNN